MSDIASELPIRSQLPGQVLPDDVIVKLGDATNPTTQQASVDSFGSQSSIIKDAAGTAITSVANGGVQALQVNIQSAGPVSPGTVANFSDLIGGQYNSTLPTLTTGQQAAVQLDSRGRVLVTSSNFPVVVDTNYGTVGANTIRTAAQIGNATGAADFNYGAIGAQTLRAAAQLGNATGAIDYNFGSASGQTIRVAALLGNASGVIDYNYGAVSAQTVRVASQIGNATGAADFNNGATGAQTLRVAANLAVGGANVSATNPVPVTISSAVIGTSINNYNTASAIAAGASSNHDYTITAAKTFQGKKIWASASGLMKIEVQVSPDGTAFSTLWVGFNSTATPNISVDLDEMVFLESGAGSKIRIIRTNLDKKAMDLYSTISGTEV